MDDRIVGPPGTRIYSDGRNTIATFRDRELVRVSYTDIRLDARGHRDVVTQRCLNQVSRMLDLGYHIVRPRGSGWIVETQRNVYIYRDGVHIRRSVGRDHEYVRYEDD
jgi:hypothetical protein